MRRHLCLLVAWAVCALGMARGVPAAEPIRIEAGLLRFIDEIEVPARAEGLITQLKVAEGDEIERGHLLAVVDDQEAQLMVARTKMEWEIARDHAASDVDIKLARESILYATSELQRLTAADQRLPGSISAATIEQRRWELVKSKLELEQATRDKRLAQLTCQLKEREIAIAEHNVRIRQVESPATGMIVEIVRREGEWVKPGDKVLRIVRLDRLRIEGLVSIDHVRDNLQGARAVVETALDGEQREPLEGKVVFVSPEVNSVNRQVRVWAEFENPDRALRPGMRAKMTIYP